MAKLIAFSGSSRSGSFNQQLVEVAAEGARKAGAEVTVLNLGDFEMPVFNEDQEAKNGVPKDVLKLKQLLINCDGVLIASPEYNSSLSALLKNTIDWVSRPVEGEKPMEGFRGKVAGIMAASPGGLGGLRGLVHLRAILQNIGMIVVPAQHALRNANKAFDESGNLTDEKERSKVHAVGNSVAEVAAKLFD